MDASRQTIEDADLSKLNEKDKGELRQFLSMESKRSEVQASACFLFPHFVTHSYPIQASCARCSEEKRLTRRIQIPTR